MLVGDFYDVADREPALLTVWQADPFVEAWEGERGEDEGGGRTNKGRLEVFVSFMQEKSEEINKLLGWRVEGGGSYEDQGL